MPNRNESIRFENGSQQAAGYMRLSSLADYAVVMMSAAARHCGAGAALDAATHKRRKVNATTLSAETGIPLPTAQKLVSRLSTAGLLESSRGTGGGVRLARPPAAISLADIVEAVEGPNELTSCVDGERHDCALESCCQVRPHMHIVNGAVRGALAGVSLASLSRAPAKAGALSAKAPAFAGAHAS